MADVQALRELLSEQYGIRSDHELSLALDMKGRLNIGVFASPVCTEGEKEDETVQQIA